MRKRAFSVLKRRVAANVRQFRLEQGLTIADAAKLAGLAPRHWQKIEAAEQNLTIGTIAKLSNGLRVKVQELLR